MASMLFWVSQGGSCIYISTYIYILRRTKLCSALLCSALDLCVIKGSTSINAKRNEKIPNPENPTRPSSALLSQCRLTTTYVVSAAGKDDRQFSFHATR